MKGRVAVGGGAPVSVQSMTKTSPEDLDGLRLEIRSLLVAGCDVLRMAIPTEKAAESMAVLKEEFSLPLIADIHFNYRLALLAVEAGADGLRINPGNIGGRQRLARVAEAAAARGIPIRVGVNSGSLPKAILSRHGHTARALVESAKASLAILESTGFTNMLISMKSTDVPMTIEAHRLLAPECDYPFHIGITEAGIPRIGGIRSAVGIGALLAEGIGDTLRVSLTGDPVEEVETGIAILRALGMREGGPLLISCPTCGRCKANIITLAERVEAGLRELKGDIKVAVMGCEVNGPGEARAADLGLAAGGRGYLMLFKAGKKLRRVREDEAVEALLDEARSLLSQGSQEGPPNEGDRRNE